MLKLKINDLLPPHIRAEASQTHTRKQGEQTAKHKLSPTPHAALRNVWGELCGITKWLNQKTKKNRDFQKPSNQQIRFFKATKLD